MTAPAHREHPWPGDPRSAVQAQGHRADPKWEKGFKFAVRLILDATILLRLLRRPSTDYDPTSKNPDPRGAADEMVATMRAENRRASWPDTMNSAGSMTASASSPCCRGIVRRVIPVGVFAASKDCPRGRQIPTPPLFEGDHRRHRLATKAGVGGGFFFFFWGGPRILFFLLGKQKKSRSRGDRAGNYSKPKPSRDRANSDRDLRRRFSATWDGSEPHRTSIFPLEIFSVWHEEDEALGSDQGRHRLCRHLQAGYLATDTAKL